MLSDEQKTASAGIHIVTPEKVMNADANLVFRPGQSMLASITMDNVLPSPVVLKGKTFFFCPV